MTLEKGNQETKEKRGPPQWRAFHVLDTKCRRRGAITTPAGPAPAARTSGRSSARRLG
jgi:hypothetical protein